jgi:catalase-peroxidase
MSENKCPVTGSANNLKGTYPKEWWPDQLDLSLLTKPSQQSNPMDPDFDYVSEFESLDLTEVKAEIEKVMTTSQSWWPADYGNYGPLFIRMAWHSAGTYRTTDGRGGGGSGMQRFAPLNSWPDNANLDKARRLLWPVKKKYGKKLSWADLMILAGNVALENMGFKTFGFAGGRIDEWEPDQTYWGSEKKWLDDNRYSGNRELENPLAAVQMGLIYVNPEGPNGNPDPLLAAKDIRETFARMAMNDEETVALIAGGHTFGKTHGAAAATNVGPEPEAAPIAQMGLGWKNSFGSGAGIDTITSGLEGAWTPTPTQWSNSYFTLLFKYEWQQTKSPAGAIQWIPVDPAAGNLVPDAHDPSKKHAPIMLTTDLALRFDPAYEVISRKFATDFNAFAEAFAKAWFKLTHRDMGPIARYKGDEVPSEKLIWQDPLPVYEGESLKADCIVFLKDKIQESGLSTSELVKTAWAAASYYRKTDKRGGANGARIRFAEILNWPVNDQATISKVLKALEKIKGEFDKPTKQVSISDLIVLGGVVGIERAIKATGMELNVPFTPGRVDANLADTDFESFKVLEPLADGFRNYLAPEIKEPAERLLVEKALLLDLNPVEMTVLVGGLRVLAANTDSSNNGVFTNQVEKLTNDFFVNLLSMEYNWRQISENNFEGFNALGEVIWRGTRADLVFGSNSQLRAISEVYASDDGLKKFQRDFVAAWTKVMNLDRFDLHR